MTVPTRRQLSKRIPFTRPTSRNRSVGMTRTFSIELQREEVSEELEAHALALLRVKLHSEYVALADDRRKAAAVRCGREHRGLVGRPHVIAVHEVEVRRGRDAVEQRCRPSLVHFIPA